MNRRPLLVRAMLALFGLFCAGAVAGVVAAGPAGADGTAPPWVTTSPDPNGVGGLTFYDASGNAITSGSSNTAPFAAYAQGRVATQDSSLQSPTATLYVYVPQQGQLQESFTNNEQSGQSTNYPNSSAPGSLASSDLPLNTGHSDDLSLATIESDYPNSSTDPNYAGIYEVRLYTGAKQHGQSVHYDYADIKIDNTAHTWSLVYTPGDSQPTPDATSLTSTAPSSLTYKTAGTFTATLTDTTKNTKLSGASVELQYRSSTTAAWKNLKAATTNSAGTASTTVTPSVNYYYQWVYAGDATHAAATSDTKFVYVKYVVSLYSTAKTFKAPATEKLYGTVAPSAAGQKVVLQVASGTTYSNTSLSAVIMSQKLPNGTTGVGYVISIKFNSKGSHRYRIYKPSSSTNAAGYSSSIVETAT